MPEHDSDVERRLAQRLRAYEGRIPDAEPPPPGTRRARALRWPLLAGVGGTALIAGALLALAILQPRPDDPIGVATPSASATTAATPTDQPTPAPTVEPTQSAATSPVLTPTPTATPLPTLGPITRWAQAAEFSTDAFAEEVRDLTYGAGHFIAVGYREPLDQRGMVGPRQIDPLIWISADGSSWEALELGPQFDGAYLSAAVALPDGTAAIYGSLDRDPDPLGQELEAAAWSSADGRTWTRFELALPARPDASYALVITSVADGAKGYLTLINYGRVEGPTEELWYSADGSRWEVVRQLGADGSGWTDHIRSFGAGAEGFVFVGERSEDDAEPRVYMPFVEASSDGRTWIKAAADNIPDGPNLLVAAVGGDWIVTQTDFETSTDMTWFSHNGLAWEKRAAIEVPMPEGGAQAGEGSVPVIGQVVGAGDRAFITGALVYCCHAPWFAAGIWSSFDASSWERLAFPEDAVIEAAATHDGVTVLGGYTGATPASGWQARATFWVSERD